MGKELLMMTARGKFIVRQVDKSGRELEIVRKLTEKETDQEFLDRMNKIANARLRDSEEIGLMAGFTAGDMRRLVSSFRLKLVKPKRAAAAKRGAA